MNCLKRAYLYVTRKKGKSILLFLILLVTATFVLSGLCIGDATRQAQMNLRKNLGGAFDMTINYSEDTGVSYGRSMVKNARYGAARAVWIMAENTV